MASLAGLRYEIQRLLRSAGRAAQRDAGRYHAYFEPPPPWEVKFTLLELCRVSGASEMQIFEWIAHGAIEPTCVSEKDGPHFDSVSLRRVRRPPSRAGSRD
ncbi:hypothetical protein Bxe_C0553 [Paraburkholderia xenovorans LB400]|uniref:MerR family transcriptional regulator n=1 Tax=Paraburkholderia xenovorans (strain LB400) TaxID=266265 RepID=Q13HI7_PARXL|nr:hypothetical protein Bxe_C0553 [Paraburkholderia xenovorans LB400]